MKLLFEYTLDYLKRNRRSSLAIMTAILMTSTMLSTLCGFLYNIYADNLSDVLQQDGNWHGELYDITPGSSLAAIESFDSVESIMIKGAWKTAKIDDPRRDYLIWRDANAEYWHSMPEGDLAMLEGRAPMQTNEVALSKQYFEHHPELTMGDTLTLPVGDRIARDGSIIIPPDTEQPGEEFVQTGTVTMTVVGKLDVTTSSTVPGYTALGFLEPTAIQPDDDLTVYLRFHDIHDTYRELPEIAKAVGYEPDEYGKYLLRYNTSYLTLRAVLSPEQTGLLPQLLARQMPLTFAFIGLFVTALFVLIIHNAFGLSSSARLSQLGIFASVGATPKQIKRSVVLEAFLLTAIPLPLGLLLGHFSVGIFLYLNNRLRMREAEDLMSFALGWQSVLPSILLTLLTVWWASMIPARKIARMSPIAAIRQGETKPLKNPGRFFGAGLGKLFGVPGELAANALRARKKSYRTATLSLVFSFLVLAFFVCTTSATDASKAIFKTEEMRWAEQDIVLMLHNVATEEDYDTVTSEIEAIDGIKTAHWFNTLDTAAWVSEDGFSPEFEELGGFNEVEKYLGGMQLLQGNMRLPLLREGKRRIDIATVGLDDATFADYCSALGIDSAPFYKEDCRRGILYHTVNDITTSTKRNPVNIPFLNVKQGDTIRLTEEIRDSSEGDFTFDLEIAAIADQMPPLGASSFGIRYSAIQFMPMSQVKQLATHCAQQGKSVRIEGVLQVSDPTLITPVRTEAERIFESYFGSGDYWLIDEDEYYIEIAAGDMNLALIYGFVVVLLAVIGLSNAWSTVRGTLNARRREFAMLRSVGLPPRSLRRMLSLEAVLLGLMPLLLGLPLALVLQGFFLYLNEVRFIEWLPFAPWLPLLLYITAILGVILLAYIIGSRKLLKETIIEAIKTDSI